MLRKSGRLRNLILVCLLFIFGIQSSCALEGLNLCIEADGQVEIESGNSSCCANPHGSEVGLIPSGNGESCESCIDIHFGGSEPIAVASLAAPTLTSCVPAPASVEMIAPPRTTPMGTGQNSPMNGSLMAIRSIVLRV